jgi:hypothetical protein
VHIIRPIATIFNVKSDWSLLTPLGRILFDTEKRVALHIPMRAKDGRSFSPE